MRRLALLISIFSCICVAWPQIPALRLINGASMPQMGLGTLRLGEGEISYQALVSALQAGYRHIDINGNAINVGRALRQCGVDRDQIWLSATLRPQDFERQTAAQAVDSLLSQLGIDYLDMAYMQQPLDDSLGHWRELAVSLADGKTKALGISNFDFDDNFYSLLIDSCDVRPDAVQIVRAPYWAGDDWLSRLHADGIVVECLCPLGIDSNEQLMLSNPVLSEIAVSHGKTPLQVMMRWHLQQGLSIVPATDNLEDIRVLIDIFDFSLSPHEMETVQMLCQGIRPAPFVLQQLQKLINGYQLYEE